MRAVDLEVEERVEEVEAGDPARDRRAEHPRLPRQLAGDRDPGADRREPVDGAEPEVREPGEALQVRVDHEAGNGDRPQPAHERVELADRDQEDARATPGRRATPATTVSRPPGSSRAAVRGLRASMPASISRLRPIASDRAPTIATVIQRRSCADGHAVDREQRADVGERQREDRVLDLHERGEALRVTRASDHVWRCAVSLAGEQLQRVLERRPQHGEAVAAAAGRAGQVDDERLAADAGHPAREQGVRRLRDRVGADRLGDPRAPRARARHASPRA